jgi:predicted alpha/beta-hydrolase family hydrolase
VSTAEDVATPVGRARAHTTEPAGAVRGTVVLGHGAGGGVESVDLVALTAAASAAGWRVVRVEQPWRVAGKRIAPAPARLDESWCAVLAQLRTAGRLTGPLVLGGRSAGARVACRTADAEGAAGVLALAFPLHPPGKPDSSRAPELVGVATPLLVVQGETDAFGGPAEVAAALSGRRTASVYAVPGDHALERNPDVVAAAALSGLTDLFPARLCSAHRKWAEHKVPEKPRVSGRDGDAGGGAPA